MFAWFDARSLLTRIALGQPVDHLQIGIGRDVDKATSDLRVAAHIVGIDQQQGRFPLSLQVRRPSAASVAVDDEMAVLERKPDWVQLDRSAHTLGRNYKHDRFLGEPLNLPTQRRYGPIASHSPMSGQRPAQELTAIACRTIIAHQ